MTTRSIARGATGVLAGLALGGALATATADAAPRGAVGGISSPASGTLTLSVRAVDDGVGLARAEARVDGAVVDAVALGDAGCADGAGCPSSVDDVPLAVPTARFGDGVHRLEVSVTDAAGDRAVLVDQALVFNNTPPEQHSTAVLTLGSGDASTPGAPDGQGAGGTGAGGAGAVGGAGSGGATGSGTRPVCLAPRLSMFLKDKPLRVAKGVPVLRRGGRYRYGGTLTCAVAGRRVHAPSGVVIGVRAQLGGRTVAKNGVATRSDGGATVILAAPSARVLEFRYTSVDGTTTRVRLRIAVAAKTTKTAKTTKKKAR
ncbi:MAG TPA: hypothetical protein VFG42_26160 [Baekduia sp.]|uniref:hypothetical protein n=1 Tax=Baekduia sp. TaxID=2600305 RepID=UPI002D7834FF|nr:hypothetical protein [Baekduia sp.]HET6510305.1 hypothetical protein [Baekduia sp.]